jgi:hypothetical protein
MISTVVFSVAHQHQPHTGGSAAKRNNTAVKSSHGREGALNDDVSKWEINPNELQLGRKLGKGAFGVRLWLSFAPYDRLIICVFIYGYYYYLSLCYSFILIMMVTEWNQTVYKSTLHGKEVAVKKLSGANFDEETIENFRKEVAILR